MTKLPPQLVAQVRGLLERARRTSLAEPSAAVLATVDENQQPSARVVLVRDFDEHGFVFYTNTLSRKGRQLAANPRASLCLFWDELHEQVRVEGTARPVDDREADSYWRTRPRESQIGAWASDQSRTLDEVATLAARVARYDEKFSGREVPRPSHWSGYRLTPHRVEFWSRGDARLHHRVVHELDDGHWTSRLLYP